MWFSLFDKNIEAAFERFYIPLSFFKKSGGKGEDSLMAYKPIHLEIHLRGGDYEAHPAIYISMVLECQLQSFVDSICTPTLHWIDFDPLPYCSKMLTILMTTDGYVPSAAPFIRCDLNDE